MVIGESLQGHWIQAESKIFLYEIWDVQEGTIFRAANLLTEIVTDYV